MELRYGVMVSTSDFGSDCRGSNPLTSTKSPWWWNGRHVGLKIPWTEMSVWVQIPSEAPKFTIKY